MRRYRKTALSLTKASLITSIGASAVTGAGGSAASLTTLSSSLPTIGTIAGGGMALSAARGMMPRKRRRR